jgi:hypothetical protein
MVEPFSSVDQNKPSTLSCLVRIYNEECPKLNDLVEIFGVYTVNVDNGESRSSIDDGNDDEDLFVHLPPSIYPRLQCITYRRLGSSFPLFQEISVDGNPIFEVKELNHQDRRMIGDIKSLSDGVDARRCREDILTLISGSIYNDPLLAEYILLAILSRVYGRDVSQAVGYIALDILLDYSTDSSVYIQRLQSCLAMLIPRVVKILGDEDSLNEPTLCLRPSKNDHNLMNISPLQMGDGAVMIIDETDAAEKENGVSLSSSGKLSVHALRTFITMQQLPVFYGVYELNLPTNNPIIVVSKNTKESLILQESEHESHAVVKILARGIGNAGFDVDATNLEKTFDMTQLRKYWALVRILDVAMSGDALKRAEDTFVKERKDCYGTGQTMTTAADFSRWLSIARLLALSYGSTTITPKIWDDMLSLERRRKSRLQENMS